MTKFDFNAPAELFPSRNRRVTSRVKYRRFDKAAEAIRFAIEDMPEQLLLGATIQVGDERLGHREIRALYESDRFPLKRSTRAA
jgi:Arc/MetJ-type ribon-helix-helix transcriptional regulator